MQSEGKEEQAIEYYQNALSLKPDDIPARFAMAELFEDETNTDAALVLYMDILSLDSSNEEAYRKVIAIYDARGDYNSILALEKTVKSDSLLQLFADYHVTEPTLSPSVGDYDEYIEVVPFSVDSYDIYYTKDGSDPTTNHGQLYDSNTQILLEKNGTYVIKAVCRNEKGINSDVVSGTYVIGVYPPAYATLEPDGGHVEKGQTVTIQAGSGCSIYYTWDGTDPTELSDRYYVPLEIPEGNSVLSVLVVNNKTGLNSGIYRSNFIVD
jgi:hypothetical protein